MFYDCSWLTSLNLSNFETSEIIYMNNMFKDCYNLEYINIKNFIENSSLYLYDIFNNDPDNVIVWLNNNSKGILDQIKNKNSLNIKSYHIKISFFFCYIIFTFRNISRRKFG